MSTESAIRSLILGGIAYDLENIDRIHKTGPRPGGHNKKLWQGKTTRGVSDEYWARHGERLEREARRV